MERSPRRKTDHSVLSWSAERLDVQSGGREILRTRSVRRRAPVPFGTGAESDPETGPPIMSGRRADRRELPREPLYDSTSPARSSGSRSRRA